MSDYEDKVLHSYDGIQEYDNPLPGWWKGLFVLSIIWSVIYVVGIGLGYLPSYGKDLKAGEQEIAEIRLKYRQSRPPIKVTPELLAKASADEALVLEGGKVYASNCASCHGDVGQGQIGPNLTDPYWLHGGDHLEIFNVVKNGVKDNGMPDWGNILTPEDMVNVVAYINTLQGSNPAKPKKPEGKLYKPKKKKTLAKGT